MLIVYRRHLKKCDHRNEGRKYRRCNCPVWVDGSIAGEEVRQTQGTRSWEEAQEKVRQWEAEDRKPIEPAKNYLSVEAAFDRYVADAESIQLGPAAIYKRKLLGRQMAAFARECGLRYVEEFDLNRLRDFRSTWKNRNISARKKLEQLRAFFNFFLKSKELENNPALACFTAVPSAGRRFRICCRWVASGLRILPDFADSPLVSLVEAVWKTMTVLSPFKESDDPSHDK
jgi:hypothetical protein